jgi:hypothetical protein
VGAPGSGDAGQPKVKNLAVAILRYKTSRHPIGQGGRGSQRYDLCFRRFSPIFSGKNFTFFWKASVMIILCIN